MNEKPNLTERPKHDGSYKSFFAKRRTVADTLRALTLDLRDALDFATLERMPASFVTEHLGRRHADMLWKIRTVNREWLYLLVLIEFQSTVDRRMALRMMNYAGGIWMGLGENDLGPRGAYPSVLPVVVYNGEQPWNAPTDIRDLLAPVPEQMLGAQPRHPYLLMELQTLDPSTLPYGNVLSMIARFEQARSPEQLERLVATLADWVERADAEELLDNFREWISQVLVQRHGPAGRTLELKIRQPLKEADFSELGLKERRDIQKWVGKHSEILAPDLLIIAEEFADFDRTRERLDLLAVDSAGDLVVIELKRDDSGTHVHGQAIKYASYLDRATPEEIVRLLAGHNETSEEDAETELKKHIGSEHLDKINGQQRIILASHRFAPEVTSAVLWLNDQFDRPLITCVQLTPHVDPDSKALYLQSSTIIPVPGKKQYRIQTGARGASGVAEQTSRSNPYFREIRTALDRVQELVREKLQDDLVPAHAYRPTQWGYWLYWYDQQPWEKWKLCYMIQLVNMESVSRDRWKMLLSANDVDPSGAQANWAAEVALFWEQVEGGPLEVLRQRVGEIQVHPNQISVEHDTGRKLLVRFHADTLDDSFVHRFADEFCRFIEKVTPVVREVWREHKATS